MDKNELMGLYRTMYRIRAFENQAVESFAVGDIPGFVHLSIGQEAVPTGLCSVLRKSDYITSTHRGHGHMIAKGGETKRMMAELFAKSGGYCHGKGGSMHISDINIGMLGANGMVGGGFGIATGAALAQVQQSIDNVVVCFFGDGASNEGLFHEAMNFSALWRLPLIFVCENNLYGISTRTDRSMKVQDVARRAAAYDVPSAIVDGNDVIAVREAAEIAVSRAREGKGPTLLECKTYKHRGHFEGDPGDYRPPEEVAAWKEKDPLPRFEKLLTDGGTATEAELAAVRAEIDAEIKAAVNFAIASPPLDPSQTVVDVYSDIVEEGR